MPRNRISIALIASVVILPASLQAQDRAGQVLWIAGHVERVNADGVASPLSKGDAVHQGDVIRTGPGSHAQLVMSDQALVAIRPDSNLKLATYAYQGLEDGSEVALVELFKGGLRSITGAIGRTNKENYLLKTPTHLIGIRGTDHETFADDAGTYNRVTVGGTYLQGPDGRVDLAPGEVGFARLLPGSAPSRLDRTPEFMHTAALRSANTGPLLREASPGDHHRLGDQHRLKAPLFGDATQPKQGATPVLPSQALGENSQTRGLGKGGKCDGPCVDPLKKNKDKKGGP